MDYIKLKAKIESSLVTMVTKSRYEHTKRVEKESIELAKIYGVDEKKAVIASLCHDLYKNISNEEANEIIKKARLGKKYIDNLNLGHSKIASYMAKKNFGIEDDDILNAISYHTTGRKAMSTLEKIIFLADYIEPKRDFENIEKIRELSRVDLNKTVLEILINTKKYLEGENIPFCDRDSLEALAYYKKIVERKSEENMTGYEKANFAGKLLSEKKARDVEIIDIKEKSSFADYIVIGTGNSDRQVASLVEDVKDAFWEEDIEVKNIEGKHGTGWILMDYGDIIVNVFTEKMRDKYSLERVWADCGIIKVED